MKTLTIYTEKGHTYQFNNVENVVLNNNFLDFEYVGVRSGLKTTAKAVNFAMYTISEKKDVNLELTLKCHTPK